MVIESPEPAERWAPCIAGMEGPTDGFVKAGSAAVCRHGFRRDDGRIVADVATVNSTTWIIAVTSAPTLIAVGDMIAIGPASPSRHWPARSPVH